MCCASVQVCARTVPWDGQVNDAPPIRQGDPLALARQPGGASVRRSQATFQSTSPEAARAALRELSGSLAMRPVGPADDRSSAARSRNNRCSLPALPTRRSDGQGRERCRLRRPAQCSVMARSRKAFGVRSVCLTSDCVLSEMFPGVASNRPERGSSPRRPGLLLGAGPRPLRSGSVRVAGTGWPGQVPRRQPASRCCSSSSLQTRQPHPHRGSVSLQR